MRQFTLDKVVSGESGNSEYDDVDWKDGRLLRQRTLAPYGCLGFVVVGSSETVLADSVEDSGWNAG